MAASGSGGTRNGSEGLSGDGDLDSRRARSRLLVFVLFGWIGLFAAGAVWMSLRPLPHAELRESPFKPWDGLWEGELEIFDTAGERVGHIRVARRFRHVPSDDQFRQEGHFTVTDLLSGAEKEEKSLQTASFELTDLQRKVYKEKGSVMEVFEGVKDGNSIIWTREFPGVAETFREHIDGDTCTIEGEITYASTPGVPAASQTRTWRGLFRRVQ